MSDYNRGEHYPVDPPTRDEVGRLFEACGDTWTGRRDACLLMLMYRLGLRCNEALTVKYEDIRTIVQRGMAAGQVTENEVQTVRVMHPKGWSPKAGKSGKTRRPARPREAGLDDKSIGILQAWIEARGRQAGPLICTKAGKRINTSHVRRLMPTLAHRAGIPRRIHAHALRHAFAREMLEEGLNLKQIQHLLGHNYIATTAGYVEGLVPDVVGLTAERGGW